MRDEILAMCLARIEAEGDFAAVLADDARSAALLRLLRQCPQFPVVRGLIADVAAARQARGFAELA